MNLEGGFDKNVMLKNGKFVTFSILFVELG